MTSPILLAVATCLALVSLVPASATFSPVRAETGAEKVPVLNVRPSCEATADPTLVLPDKPSVESCLNEEETARQTLAKEWSTYSASHRRRCTESSADDDYPSYIDLMWCLRDAKTAQEEMAQKPAILNQVPTVP
jgi:hypothetical protein